LVSKFSMPFSSTTTALRPRLWVLALVPDLAHHPLPLAIAAVVGDVAPLEAVATPQRAQIVRSVEVHVRTHPRVSHQEHRGATVTALSGLWSGSPSSGTSPSVFGPVGVRTEVLDPHLEVRATPEVPYAGRLMLNVVPKYLVYEKQPCLLHRDENQS
jgi:hypothetical protein